MTAESGFRAGDVVHLTAAASVQFTRPILVRIIREIVDRHTYHGWLWIDGYELGPKGEAVARRELFVMREGMSVQVQAPRRADDPRRPIRRAPPRVG